jgi:uncharacterized protein YciI
MIFILHCRVKPGQAARLPEFRAQHFAHAQSSGLKLVGAGPTLSDDGGEIIGGLYIIEAESRAAVDAYYDSDPYCTEGIWEKTLLERFDKRV